MPKDSMWVDSKVKALKPERTTYRRSEPINQRGVGRFMIEVQPNGLKTFFFQYWRNGQKVLISVGKYKQTPAAPGLTLSAARRKADKYSTLLQDGIDPQLFRDEENIAEKERKRDVEAAKYRGSFEQLLDSYLDKLEGKASYSRVKQSLDCYIRRPFPELLRKYANEITPAHISLILKAMLQKGIKTQTNRVRSQLHAAFQHGLKWDDDPARYKKDEVLFNLIVNPVANVPKQDAEGFEDVGDHVVEDEDIKLIWDEITEDYFIAGNVIKLALATGQRAGELIRLRVEDFNIKEGYLTIPDTVSKNSINHIVPLNAIALEVTNKILKEVRGASIFAFPGVKQGYYCEDIPIHSSTLSQHVRDFCEHYEGEKFVPRDIRRTIKTNMAKIGISKEIRDRIQNHNLKKDVAEKHYNMYDYIEEKYNGLKVWNDYLDLILNPKKNVTHINKRA